MPLPKRGGVSVSGCFVGAGVVSSRVMREASAFFSGTVFAFLFFFSPAARSFREPLDAFSFLPAGERLLRGALGVFAGGVVVVAESEPSDAHLLAPSRPMMLCFALCLCFCFVV